MGRGCEEIVVLLVVPLLVGQFGDSPAGRSRSWLCKNRTPVCSMCVCVVLYSVKPGPLIRQEAVNIAADVY